ncbi:hypothetical protein AVEN_100369-1 [Araneus ventricosus]|uniref:Uncharacterized protein n=1 Tax=Araneus ventricosus TaxID=182803 RepID=A0A4Y2P2M6_ARAVE|nr:hypothetical protein AVEN_100369-1 [Araneus ventricosus]
MSGRYDCLESRGQRPNDSLFLPTLVSARLMLLSSSVRKSSKLLGSGSAYTLYFTKPHKKKSHGVMSGDLWGQGNIALLFFQALPIQRLGITLLRNSSTSSVEAHHPAERRNSSSLTVI